MCELPKVFLSLDSILIYISWLEYEPFDLHEKGERPFFKVFGFLLYLVRNLGSLCFYALDLVGYMHLSPELSKSYTIENNSFKNHYVVKI